MGIIGSMEQFDKKLLQDDIRESVGRAGKMVGIPLYEPVLESWVGYWSGVLLFGAIGGLFLWWIGGWWYKIRIKWSGHRDPDSRIARLVYVYSSFTRAGPTVVSIVFLSLFFDHYLDYWQNPDFNLSPFLMIFPFWSLATSYIGVTTCFEVSKTKARIWFLILPVTFYLLGLTVVVGLISYILDGGLT
ncbi:MAG: hypothetical protein HQL69_17475 [Magnetococcales bacterium]|nr:hypothetical protein [Magnetococcales bacterium]